MEKNTLVLGASEKVWSYAYQAVKRLLESGNHVIGIGKKNSVVLGVTIHTKKVLVKDIHTVTMYLNKENQKEYFDYIVELQPQRVIFNPGAENSALEELLERNNIGFERACTLVLLATGQY